MPAFLFLTYLFLTLLFLALLFPSFLFPAFAPTKRAPIRTTKGIACPGQNGWKREKIPPEQKFALN